MCDTWTCSFTVSRVLKLTVDFPVNSDMLRQLPLERVVTHERVDSTNSEALRLLRQGQICPFLVLASQQTEGRGRRGRRWESPPGAGLYYSLTLEVPWGMQNIAALSPITALSVCSALEKLGVNKLELKWPNDVLGDARKLSGILLESLKIEDCLFIVIGVGVNLNLPGATKCVIGQPVTDVKELLGSDFDVDRLAAGITAQLLANISCFGENGFSEFVADWNDRDAYLGKQVRVRLNGSVIQGEVQGVNALGELKLRTESGDQVIRMGEIMPSVRLIASDELMR